MRPTLFALSLLAACTSTPDAKDGGDTDAVDTDPADSADDTSGGGDTGSDDTSTPQDTGEDGETDEVPDVTETGDTAEPVDLGTEIFSETFESPELSWGDWTESAPSSWSRERNPVSGPTAGVGVLRPPAGLASLSPFAAPGEGNQALFLNARDSAWSRASSSVATMTAGTTYTLTAAVALRTDVQVPSSMSVSFWNSFSKAGTVPEVALGTLLDDTVKGSFQTITVTHVANASDDGAPLSVRFAVFHPPSALAQLLVDDVRVYAKAP